MMIQATVIALSKSETHSFSKINCDKLLLIKGLGIEGDAHMGTTVKHRSRVKQDASQPNLRQVHLIHSELFDEVALKGFQVFPGQIGENITTRGIDLLSLPKGTLLKIGNEVIIEVTGLRNPCSQLNTIKDGLMNAVLGKDANGNLILKAGIMGIVISGGEILLNDTIKVYLPQKPFVKLERV
jgi:MOSC domain-containing protein YiiM